MKIFNKNTISTLDLYVDFDDLLLTNIKCEKMPMPKRQQAKIKNLEKIYDIHDVLFHRGYEGEVGLCV